MNLVSKPQIFQLEASSKCNLACTMCPHPIMTREKEHMDFDLFRTIILRDAPPDTKVMGLHILGESLLNPNLPAMIEYARSHGVKIELATNGTLLTDWMSHRLIEAGLSKIWLSFDGGSKEVYESIRVGANFEKTVKNISRFLELNLAVGSPIAATVQMVGMRANEGDIENFKELWSGKGAQVKVKFLDTWAGTLMLDEVPPPDFERYPCAEPFNRVAVLANGDVVPCCRDWSGAYAYGNLREESLESIWHGVKAQALREEHLTGNYISEPCKSCREWAIPMSRDEHEDPDMQERHQVQARLPNTILYDTLPESST